LYCYYPWYIGKYIYIARWQVKRHPTPLYLYFYHKYFLWQNCIQKWPRPKGTLFYIAKAFKNLLMNHWLKSVSIVELDPQAMLTNGILSKNIIHYDVR